MSSRTLSAWLALAGAASIIGLTEGCGRDAGFGPSPVDTVQAYWALQPNYQTVNLSTIAPYDTMRLTATPVNVAGVPLTGLGRPTFSTSDSAVAVDSTGLITAHYVTTGGPVVVTASLKAQGVTLRTNVLVQVTDTVPLHPLTTFSLQPAPGDSAKRAVDWSGDPSLSARFVWAAAATNSIGDTICTAASCPLLVAYRSSNSLVATIDSLTGTVQPLDTGRVVFTAATWAYGVGKRDSVVFTIGYKILAIIPVVLSTEGGHVAATFGTARRILMGVNGIAEFACAPGGVFSSNCDRPVDIAFDNPAVVDTGSIPLFGVQVGPNGRGNIPAFGGDTLRSFDALQFDVRVRRFPVRGTYRYYSTLFPSDTFEIVIQ